MDHPIPSVFQSQQNLSGLLFIGDPHVEGRTPGFRKDNYPESILRKLEWILDYATHQQLLPVLLGDIFDKPRDNPNWLLSRLLDMFADKNVVAVYGNHDCANPSLDDNDSLTILVKSGVIRLLDAQNLWHGQIEGRSVLLGASPYRHPIPEQFAWPTQLSTHKASPGVKPLVIWLTHHDLVFPSHEEAAVTELYEIPGIDFVINGHIHRRAPTTIERGTTTWVNPGNIARRSRADAIRGHVPAVLRMDVTSDGQWLHYVEVPHRAASDVFFELNSLESEVVESHQSSFVAGLAKLQSRKTYSGAGLLDFLRDNITQFEPEVANEILELAKEVLETTNPRHD